MSKTRLQMQRRSLPAGNEAADLVRLQQENRELRAALAGKMRLENIVITTRTELNWLMERAGRKVAADAQFFVGNWLLPFLKVIQGIELDFVAVNTAICSGARGSNLTAVINGIPGDLTSLYDQLTALMQYAPPGVPDRMAANAEFLGGRILALRAAIYACTMGGDDGAALRALTLNEGTDFMRDLTTDVIDQIDRLGRPEGKTAWRAHLRDWATRLKATHTGSWGEIANRIYAELTQKEKRGLTSIEAEILKRLRDSKDRGKFVRSAVYD